MPTLPNVTQPIRARAFFQAVYGDLPGYVELRALRVGTDRQRAFVRVGDHAGVAAFAKAHRGHQNLYIGVSTRRSTSNGTTSNLGALPALFVDLDFKDFDSEASARAALAAVPSPSIVIATGHGVHAWWLLDVPLYLGDPLNVTLAKLMLRGLARAVGGDLASAEPARILRLPNTFNHKTSPPRLVQIDVFEPGRRYRLDEFSWLPVEQAAPVEASPAPRVVRPSTGVSLVARGRAYCAKVPPPDIEDASDNRTYVAACFLVRDLGLDAADVVDILWAWAGGRTGWTRAFIVEKVRNAARYARGPLGSRR